MEEEPSLELTVILLNINKGQNPSLLDSCKTLKDYAEYTYRVRKYAKTMHIEDAVERTITECINEGILTDFLRKNQAEAKKMSIHEYDYEKHMQQEREEWEEIGRQAALLEFLEEKGEIPTVLREKIFAMTDVGILKSWTKLAVTAQSVEEFIKQISNSTV